MSKERAINKMIDFKEIPFDTDYWELFARDFFQKLGFFIETPPDRGADGGKDILMTEEITGKLYQGRFRWLVSCKHFATSGNSVNETKDEPNIRERMDSFKADGFMGFYSTIASSGLNTRLHQLRNENKIKDYRIFDGKMIENYLILSGFSDLMFRYFPESYKVIKPLHLIADKYEPITCKKCDKDLLMGLFQEAYKANIIFVKRITKGERVDYIDDVYCTCKGECDSSMSDSAFADGYLTSWNDISDLVIPIKFLNFIFALMNRLRSGMDIYKDSAYLNLKMIIIALAQKVLRFTTEEERERFEALIKIEGL
jgi:hypothetical protein